MLQGPNRVEQVEYKIRQRRVDMMYNGYGSVYDSGQMDSGQSVCRPALGGPTASWLNEAAESSRRYRREDGGAGQPVAVRVMTNGVVSPPSERSDYCDARNQTSPGSPSHLAFLYDRAQQPQQQQQQQQPMSPSTGPTGMTSPHHDGYWCVTVYIQ